MISMKIDLDKETLQAIGVLALVAILIVLVIVGGRSNIVNILIGALITKLGLKEGSVLVDRLSQ